MKLSLPFMVGKLVSTIFWTCKWIILINISKVLDIQLDSKSGKVRRGKGWGGGKGNKCYEKKCTNNIFLQNQHYHMYLLTGCMGSHEPSLY